MVQTPFPSGGRVVSQSLTKVCAQTARRKVEHAKPTTPAQVNAVLTVQQAAKGRKRGLSAGGVQATHARGPAADIMAWAAAGQDSGGVPFGTIVMFVTGVFVPLTSCVAVSVKQLVVTMS